MKKILFTPILFLLLVSCQLDDVSDETQAQRIPALSESVLERVAHGVSHSGSFDDVVDQSPCFSIDFPYNLYVDGNYVEIKSKQDLSKVFGYQTIEILFPVNVTFFDYITEEISNQGDFEMLVSTCFMEPALANLSKCMKIDYPLELSLYNTDNSTFNTKSFTADMDVYEAIITKEDHILMNINYPMTVITSENGSRDLHNNDELIDYIYQASLGCES